MTKAEDPQGFGQTRKRRQVCGRCFDWRRQRLE